MDKIEYENLVNSYDNSNLSLIIERLEADESIIPCNVIPLLKLMYNKIIDLEARIQTLESK